MILWGAAQSGGQGFLFGFRVPKDYFIAKGYGDTNDVRSRPSAAHKQLLHQRHQHSKGILLLNIHLFR